MLKLTQNYRSTQTIVDASRQIIVKSPERVPLDLWSDVVSQTRVAIYHAPTYKAEAEYVVHSIEKMLGGITHFSLDSGRVESHDEASRSFGDFAVLYRLGAQGHALAEAFERSGMPFQRIGQASLYEHKDIREILAYLWLVYNPDASFYLDVLQRSTEQVCDFLQNIRQNDRTMPVVDLIKRIHVFHSGGTSPEEDSNSAERMKRLIAGATPFQCRLKDFLEFTMLHKETDDYDPRADRVTLMTLHASKGLEFPVVFIIGCEDTLIPYQRGSDNDDIEEERRLLYVGMTRAKDHLILTHAEKRFLFGRTMKNPQSPFLSDIECTLKEMKQRNKRAAAPPKDAPPQLRLL